ncbi:MAG TPA: LarC family nickel insertion protein [Ktedonobacteraceae bacterium]|nr:LarC family nickel insertion protein [Ktedonobacteraceae bacterium]
MQKIAFLDCSMGISGEMLLGALLDSGVEQKTLDTLLTLLPIQGCYFAYERLPGHNRYGTRVSVVYVTQQTSVELRFVTLLAQLRGANLSTVVRERALAALQCLGEHMASMQGILLDEVTLAYEQAVKMLVEIVGVAFAMDALHISHLYVATLPLALGSAVNIEPDPLTLAILRGVNAPWRPGEGPAALVTPVAAALLATLGRFEKPELTIEQVGYGYAQPQGDIVPCLRLYLGQQLVGAITIPGEADTDWVTVIETHIDNMSGELLGGLMDRLLAVGALDVSYAPIQMKKNRPATRITVICLQEDGERLALLLLRETSTLGVRVQRMQRLKAQRDQQRITTPLGEMVVKVKRLGEQITSAAPEYEECQRIARACDLPLADVYEVAQRAIQDSIFHDSK